MAFFKASNQFSINIRFEAGALMIPDICLTVRGCLEVLLWRKEREMEGMEKGRYLFGEVEMVLQEGKTLLKMLFNFVQRQLRS